MMYFLIFFFLEIFITIEVGAYLGGLMTIIEIILSFVLGMFLLQSLKVSFMETVMDMARNKISKEAMLVGNLLSFIGCILLMLPGILSDFIGLLFQISLFDTLIIKLLMRKKKRKAYEDDNIIDVEIIEDDFKIDGISKDRSK